MKPLEKKLIKLTPIKAIRYLTGIVKKDENTMIQILVYVNLLARHIDNDDLYQAEQDIKSIVNWSLKEIFLMDDSIYEITVMGDFGYYLQNDPDRIGWKIFDWIKSGGFIATYSMYMGSIS